MAKTRTVQAGAVANNDVLSRPGFSKKLSLRSNHCLSYLSYYNYRISSVNDLSILWPPCGPCHHIFRWKIGQELFHITIYGSIFSRHLLEDVALFHPRNLERNKVEYRE